MLAAAVVVIAVVFVSDGLMCPFDWRCVLPPMDSVDVVLDIGHLVEHFGTHGAREGVSFVYLLVSGQSYACPETLPALWTRKPGSRGRGDWGFRS